MIAVLLAVFVCCFLLERAVPGWQLPACGPGRYGYCSSIACKWAWSNVRTPRWVGFVFQRPEMHRIHHQHGRHKNNYGDITWWDMLFGTYENPEEWTRTCGFDAEMEEQLGPMPAFRDVDKVKD